MPGSFGHDLLSGGDGGGPWPALSDLLAATTLIFCVLFAITVVPAIRANGKLAAMQTTLDSLEVAVSSDSQFQVRRFGDYLRITIGGDVVFPQNRSGLSDMNVAGRGRLEALARVLRSPEALSNIDQIHIVGHTSSEGEDEHNWRLSSERAGTIALFLIQKGGLPACKVTALGRGRYYPTNPASARLSRDPDPRDRRIEVEIRPRVLNDSAQTQRARDCVERVRPRG